MASTPCRPRCMFYAKGRCLLGAQCTYVHAPAAPPRSSTPLNRALSRTRNLGATLKRMHDLYESFYVSSDDDATSYATAVADMAAALRDLDREADALAASAQKLLDRFRPLLSGGVANRRD